MEKQILSEEFRRMQKLAGLLENESLDEDLYSNIKKGIAGTALATSLLTSPSMASNEPKPSNNPKEIVNYGLSKPTNNVIASIRQQLNLSSPLKDLTIQDLKSKYSTLNDSTLNDLKTKIEQTHKSDDIISLQTELNWILGNKYGDIEINGILDKSTINGLFKYLGKLIVEKPSIQQTSSVSKKSYPFGHYK
jgi:hypothetical protein